MQLFKGLWSLPNVTEIIELDAELQRLAQRGRGGTSQRNLVRRRITATMQAREQVISITDAERRLREYLGN